jgi:diguanylate cyclase (GGDEF)-like protein
MYGKISGAPVVHVCFPVFDRNGARRGFVSAAMHLTRVQDRLMREKTPEHTTITVMDRAGTVLARNRDAEEWVGTNVYKELRVGDMVARREGEGEATLKDGTQLICAFTTVAAAPWFVRVGVDADFIGSLVARDVAAHYAVFLPLLLVAVAGWLWIGRDVNLLHRRTEELSLVDALTGLWNSRSLREDLAQSIQHALRGGESLCFAMLDLDDFKQYNDRFGHVAGDEALQAAARALEGAIRAADRAYRYGGEEFCILMPGSDSDGVAAVAERVRAAVSAVALHPGAQVEPVSLSISIGVAVFPDDAQSAGEIMICADAALYQAKREGKNRVVIHCPKRDVNG